VSRASLFNLDIVVLVVVPCMCSYPFFLLNTMIPSSLACSRKKLIFNTLVTSIISIRLGVKKLFLAT